MTRAMYDSTSSADCPNDGDLYAGYIDGIYKWTDADWLRHADKVLVRIAVRATTNDGQVLDVEQGDATPWEAVAWVQLRRGAGVDPTVYCSRNDWPDVQAAFQRANIPEPHYWLAQWDNVPDLIPGAVAKQYADPPLTGGHWDASIVAPYWPGVDSADMDPTQVQALIDAAIVAYGQRLETDELLPMKQDIITLKAHTHDVPAKTIDLLAQQTSGPK